MMSEAPYAGALLLLILISGLVDATSPFIFAVQPDNRAAMNTIVLINATVSAESNWTFNINWSYHARDCRADLPIALEANRRARLKLIPDNDTNSTYVLAIDDKGKTANATVSLRKDNPLKLMVRTNMSALQLLIPELRLRHGNDRAIQIEMSLVNESTQDIHELLKKYENEPALAEHCVRISVNVSDVLDVLLSKSSTVHGRISFIEDTVPFEVTSLEDTSPPVITPISPSNSSIFSSHHVPLNLSANEPVRLWLYRLNNGSNVSFTPPIIINASEGRNTLSIFAYDYAGNPASLHLTFFVDSLPPVITPISPSNSSIFSSHRVPLNLSANEPVRLWLYRLNNGSNVSFTPPITINASEGRNTLSIFAYDYAGNPASLHLTFFVDSLPPVITPISPSNSSIFSSHHVPLNLSANEPVRLWLYRLNNGSNVSFPGGGEYANTTITAIEGENTLEVYAIDLAGNTGKTSVSFVVVKPRIATESSVQGVGDIHIKKEMSSRDIAIASEELVIGTDGKYSINSIEILSEPMNISSYPDYHYTEKIAFTGNTLTLKHKNSASQGKANITFSEDTLAIELQKQTRINIKTSSENPGISYDTEANDTFIGHKKTNVELRTSTSKVSIRHLLEGNCSSKLKLSVLE